MPPADKIRPFVSRACSREDCDFASTAEWAWIRHEQDTGHTMEPVPRPRRTDAQTTPETF